MLCYERREWKKQTGGGEVTGIFFSSRGKSYAKIVGDGGEKQASKESSHQQGKAIFSKDSDIYRPKHTG